MASPEIIELTSDGEDEISEAVQPSEHDVDLLKENFESLNGLSWVNDLVINSYFDLIVERSEKEGYAPVYAFNTFFYTTYKFRGYQSVKRWTQNIDIFSYDLIFIPIHFGAHWCLAVVDQCSKKISYYDSMGFVEEEAMDLVCKYLCQEYKDKKGLVLDPNIYAKEIVEDIPAQMNGSDSGVFLLKYAEYLSRGAKITFTQMHIGYFRQKMLQELLQKQLFPNSSESPFR